MIKSMRAKSSNLTDYYREANEEKFPEFIEAIMKLRHVLHNFRQHDFVGVPEVRKLSISRCYRPFAKQPIIYPYLRLKGRWLQDLGFEARGYMQVISIGGLILVCPETFSAEHEKNAFIESKILFSKSQKMAV